MPTIEEDITTMVLGNLRRSRVSFVYQNRNGKTFKSVIYSTRNAPTSFGNLLFGLLLASLLSRF